MGLVPATPGPCDTEMLFRPALMQGFARVLKGGGECLISDVHPEHPYSHVTIPTKRGEVAIETYKHSLDEVRRTVADVPGLHLSSLDEYYLTDLLSKPAFTGFE